MSDLPPDTKPDPKRDSKITSPVETESSNAATASGQGRRRTLYGLNVTVAVLAALVGVVLFNGLASLPALQRFIPRIDLTAGRTQTLSGQTRRTLAQLDTTVTLTAVVRPNSDTGRQVVHLLDQYARLRPDLATHVIDPDHDLEALALFYRGLDTRFADETASLRQAVNHGVASLTTLTQDLATIEAVFENLSQGDALKEGAAGDRVQAFRVAITETREHYTQLQSTLDTTLGQPVPPLDNVRIDLLQAFRQADENVLGPYRQAFAQLARQRDASMAVRDAMLKLDGPLTKARNRLQPVIDTLTLPTAPARFGRIQKALRAGEVIVVLSATQERVLPIDELVLNNPDGTSGPFLGEDRLTGALLTLGFPQPPRVIFVHDEPKGVLGANGNMNQAATRLAFTDFDVSQWRLGGETQTASAPPPPARTGQTTVWVVPPISAQRTTLADREQLAAMLRRQLKTGDGVMLNFLYDPDAQVRAAEPLEQLASDCDITPQIHTLLLRQTVATNGRTQATSAWAIHQYPPKAPLSAALTGRRVELPLPIPLTLSASAQPLLELHPPGADPAWLAEGLKQAQDIQSATPGDQPRIDAPLAVAATALGPNQTGRIMVAGDGHWLSDAQLPGRLGNSELFVNTVYWLAGLDQAIAATPRVHDVRRLKPFAPHRSTAVRWLLHAGLPVASLLLGVGVWWLRRRS
ncbi:MAG: hypothetical protein V3V20_05185 [Algisphaera sp.]